MFPYAWPDRCMSRIEEIGHRHFSRHIASPRSLRAAAYASHRIDTLRLWCHIASHRLSQTWPSSHRMASGRMASGRIASPCICQNVILLSFCPFCHALETGKHAKKRIEIQFFMPVLGPGRCLDGFVTQFSSRYRPSDPKILILDLLATRQNTLTQQAL